jgi:hypothetical protein
VAEDAADLDDVEADVDDQMAGEGVTQVVEAHPPAGPIEPRVHGRSAKYALGDVVVEKRGAVACREHVVGTARETAAALVVAEDRSELGEEGDLADGGARLRRDPMRRDAAAAACELVANVHDTGGEVDVLPAQPEHLRQAHARIGAGEKQRPIPARTSSKEPGELCACEDALVGAQRMRPLVPLEPVERVDVHIAAAEGEREHAAERGEDPLDRPRRETSRLQFAHDRDDIVGSDQRQPAAAEPG